MRKEKAFTLIEILVVISIIGLLSSIVLVALKGAQEKANIARALNFSSQIYHALGDNEVAGWGFDNNLDDESGNNYYGTYLPTGSPSYVQGVTTDSQSLSFDGGHYVKVSNSKFYDFKLLTIEGWIKPNLATGRIYIANKVLVFSFFVEPTGDVYLDVQTSPSGYCYASTESGSTSFLINDGKWHHIAATWNTSKVRIFIDGREYPYRWQQCGGGSSGGYIRNIYDDPITLGALCNVGCTSAFDYYLGVLDRVRIYDASLFPL